MGEYIIRGLDNKHNIRNLKDTRHQMLDITQSGSKNICEAQLCNNRDTQFAPNKPLIFKESIHCQFYCLLKWSFSTTPYSALGSWETRWEAKNPSPVQMHRSVLAPIEGSWLV